MTPDASVATALALLAVDPALGGLVLIGVDGWALEPWAARLAALLGGPAGVLRLPATITPEHLLGGLDLPASLQQGRRVRRTGVLAAHDGGVLWIPDPDLLAPEIAGPLAAVLRRGRVHLERDGIGAHDPARLVLLATMTAPGPPRYPALLEPAGLWLAAPDPDPRLPAGLEPAIVAARARLPTVTIADTQIAALAATALRLGVEGVQADYLAARTARAAAALAEHARVEAADLELAIALVIAPRASGAAPAQTRQPAPPEQTRDAPAGADAAGESHADPPPGPAPPAARGATEPAPGPLPVLQPGERAIVPQAVLLPPQLLGGLAGRPRARGARGTGRQAGERHLLPAHHGPPGPARAAPQRPPAASLDLAGTLTAAALRLAAGGPAGDHANPAPPARLRLRPADLRWRTPQAPAGVLFLLAVDASGSMARNRLGAAKGAALVLLERAYRHRDQVALIGVRGPEAQLLVPPTRSVARARRLLESLPAGGGTPLASALALSLAIAARAALTGHRQTLLVLLTDGRANVPLAGRAPAAHTAANVPLAGSAPAAHTAAEIAALAARWATLAATGAGATLVVDTRLRYLGDGAAVRLAAALGGRYLYLPQAGPGAVGAAAEATAQALGWRAAGANGPGG